jgi:hypothetical protein
VARTRGGLSVTDFVKCISVQEVSQSGFQRLAPVAAEFARAEGLDAHARSVEVRNGGVRNAAARNAAARDGEARSGGASSRGAGGGGASKIVARDTDAPTAEARK